MTIASLSLLIKYTRDDSEIKRRSGSLYFTTLPTEHLKHRFSSSPRNKNYHTNDDNSK